MGQQRNWTDKELDTLYDKYGLIANEALARKLNRSIEAIKQKAYGLRIVRTQQFITANAAAEIFNISTGIVLKWIKTGALKARKSTVGTGRNRAWFIDHDDLVSFIQTRYDLFDPYKIDPLLFRYWRNQVNKVLPGNFVPSNGRHWSEFEDAYLLNNRAKLTIPELATRLKRTKEAVHGRLVLLRRKGRMMPYKELWQTRKANGTATAPRKWTQEEDNYLLENWRRLKAKEIGSHIGRTEKACWARASRLILVSKDRNNEERAS